MTNRNKYISPSIKIVEFMVEVGLGTSGTSDKAIVQPTTGNDGMAEEMNYDNLGWDWSVRE